MEHPMTLTSLRPGQQGTVRALSATGDMRRRLMDIGLIAGTRVSCIERSPLGDPVAYGIRGAVIALRCEDAQNVQIEAAAEAGL